MRKLSPTKAISHALNSVWTFRQAALRIALPWLPVLLLCGLADVYFVPPETAPGEIPRVTPVQIAILPIVLVVTSSMSVSWQRFILRDEIGHGLRLDGYVLSYALFGFLLIVLVTIPVTLLLAIAIVAPPAVLLALPAIVLIVGAAVRLSIRFPAIALGERAFGFRDAWAASAGNMWQCIGLLVLYLAIVLGCVLAAALLSGALSLIDRTLGLFLAVLAGSLLLQPFFAILNASILTSLYGFFVEGRDF
ncbi:MAG: hypothetical protein IOC82_07595 [Aestuariivirga sp.]|uniref:hypothetical protein n=1 Tax=Aestuariivirga sp. TaxID=2650926 RepID=UPI0025C455FB|nr:hypothetical protein [Aestuariivirga sp.]MCA3560878.1 hypothetical protein [Aestuariivirga sp.]